MPEIRIPTINRVLIAGRLTRDPELRYTPNGKAVCSFSLAVNRRYKDSSGQWQDDTTYINVVCWMNIAELVNRYLHKGSPVLVEGRLESRSWENEAGQKRSTIEIRADQVNFLEKVSSGDGKEPE
jgi:single-strand DNA-binding protein